MNRTKRLAAIIPADADCALITSDINRRYFTGMKSSDGVLLCFREAAYLLVDFRYIEKAKSIASGCEVVEFSDLGAKIKELMSKHGASSAAVEADDITLARFERLKNTLDCELVSNRELSLGISKLRAVKDPGELAMFSRAQGIAERALESVMDKIRLNMTERELAMLLDFEMLRLGAEEISFETIVLFGANTSMPHGVPSYKELKKGEPVLIDFGAVCGGYHSDMTRTFFFGIPDEEMKSAYAVVLAAQEAALDAIHAGMTGSEADAIARDVINEGGYEKLFGHSLGHGVGLEIHEEPNLSPRSKTVLEANNVVTVEPGVYIPGRFGIRIEDMVIVKPAGVNNLTKFDKRFRCINN